jgi:CRP-like cAMP-binding protein
LDAKVTRAYFPHDGLVALLVPLSDGEAVVLDVIGRDGMVGAAPALGAPYALNDAVIQVPGSATMIAVQSLKEAVEHSGTLRDALFRYCHHQRAVAQQSAVCFAKHPISARICRWLMRMHDLSDGREFPMTQEFLARLLGVQRVSVALAAARMQRAGLIKYRRGHIQIVRARAVEKASCECYRSINEKNAILLAADAVSGEMALRRANR